MAYKEVDLNLFYGQVNLEKYFQTRNGERTTVPWKAVQGLVLDTKVFYYFFLKGDWEETIKVPSIMFAGIAVGESDGQLQPSTRKGECSPQIRTQRCTR